MSAINVNIRATHAHPSPNNPAFCDVDCKPVLVPLPLEPWRTVTMMVRLGECNDSRECSLRTHEGAHAHDCPARPVRVTCTISGKDWASSEVVDYEAPGHPEDVVSAGHICRALWAIVKALVTGLSTTPGLLHNPALVSQRDAVYAALLDMTRDEDLHEANRHALFKACPSIFPKGGVSPRPREDRPSARNLSAYVEYLIEQVGGLP